MNETERMYVVNTRQIMEVHHPLDRGQLFTRGFDDERQPRVWVTAHGETIVAFPLTTARVTPWTVVAARAFPPETVDRRPDLFRMSQEFTGELVRDQRIDWCVEETLRKFRREFYRALGGER